MREIKFRAKRLDSGEWVYGYYLNWKHFNGRCFTAAHSIFNNEHPMMLIDPKTVGQYTGLLDINGKEIFEGDIVEFNRDIWSVEFDEGSWIIQDIKYDFPSFRELYISKDLEVIGNIYENPELIKKEV